MPDTEPVSYDQPSFDAATAQVKNLDSISHEGPAAAILAEGKERATEATDKAAADGVVIAANPDGITAVPDEMKAPAVESSPAPAVEMITDVPQTAEAPAPTVSVPEVITAAPDMPVAAPATVEAPTPVASPDINTSVPGVSAPDIAPAIPEAAPIIEAPAEVAPARDSLAEAREAVAQSTAETLATPTVPSTADTFARQRLDAMQNMNDVAAATGRQMDGIVSRREDEALAKTTALEANPNKIQPRPSDAELAANPLPAEKPAWIQQMEAQKAEATTPEVAPVSVTPEITPQPVGATEVPAAEQPKRGFISRVKKLFGRS